MTKKWRPFWSYDVEKSEHWLSEMAAEGNNFVGKKGARYIFRKGEPEDISYI